MYPCNMHKSNTGLFPFCNSSVFVTIRVQNCHARPEEKVIAVIQTANIDWKTAQLLHIQSLLPELYLTVFLVSQGVSVILICQKIIWVWMACWTLHVKLHWLWFSSSSQCSLHCISGPSFKPFTFIFWISTYHLHTNVLLQLTFQQLSINVKALRTDAAQSLQHCCTIRVLCAVLCSAMHPQHHQGTSFNLLTTPPLLGAHQKSQWCVYNFNEEWYTLTLVSCFAPHGWKTLWTYESQS